MPIPYDILTGQTQARIQGPQWIITNTISMPTGTFTQADTGTRTQHGVSLIFVTTLMLANLFKDTSRSGRDLGEDQLNIFNSIESSLAGMGVNGRECLLRLICDIQSNPIGRYSVIGEVLTVLFTPKRGLNDFLHDYIEAEETGRSDGGDCTATYSKCPFSLINAVKHYKMMAKGQSSIEDKPYNTQNNNLANPITNEIRQLPQVVFN